VIAIHAPENNKDTTTRENFYEHLQTVINETPNDKYIIIMGDFNARVGNDLVPGIKQRYNENIRNENGNLLTDLCSKNQIRNNNTFFPHKEQYKYIFENSRGQRSIIDYILLNREH
jgi:exonuclease III